MFSTFSPSEKQFRQFALSDRYYWLATGFLLVNALRNKNVWRYQRIIRIRISKKDRQHTDQMNKQTIYKIAQRNQKI